MATANAAPTAASFPFQVKGVKTYRGHEGEPLRQGSLYHKGVKIGFISEGDWGGPAVLDVDKEHRPLIDAFIKSRPAILFQDMTLDYCEDAFVEEAFRSAEFSKKAASYQKKGNLCFTLSGDEEYSFRTLRHHGRALDAAAFLFQKYGAGNFTII